MSYKNVKYNAYRDRKNVSRPPGNLIETALRSATSYRNPEHFLNHSRDLMLRNSHLLYFWPTKSKIVNRYRAGDLSWLFKSNKGRNGSFKASFKVTACVVCNVSIGQCQKQI